MIDERQFDAIVEGFYSAATGTIGWNEALAPVHDAFNTRAAVMQSIDVTNGRLAHLFHGGEPMEASILDYLRNWHQLDPRRSFLLAHPEALIDRWWHCHEQFDAAFVAKDPFYRHFLPAHNSRYLATTATMVTPTLLTSFSLELPAARGPLSPDERHVVERLGRHVAEALRAFERLRRIAAETLAGHGLLEAFTYPMWLLSPDRFVYFANAAARSAGNEGETVQPTDQRLTLSSESADRRLGECLYMLENGRHGQRCLVDVRRQRGDPPAWLHLQALEPAQVLGVFGDRPQVLATLFDPRQMRELDPFALADLFNMTPTEGRVAVLLAEGLTAQGIAERLGCGVSTVRTHLRKVLAKLGATRLADAVRLLRQGDALWSIPAAQ